ncbi:MAG: hypothetical protein KF777_05815 [Planctomycetaceae bacterium]|nr:hypothetical protein [Planctomycetaceae bacterium]
MITSFNSLIRKHQKQLIVVLTGLAMFSFIFLDPSMTGSGGGLPLPLAVMLVAAVCAGGMWFIGYPRGKGMEFAGWGALVGAVVAVFSLRSSGEVPVVATNAHNYTAQDMQRLANERQIANRFAFLAGQKSGSRMAAGFGDTSERSLVMKDLLHREAESMGLKLGDAAVNEWITQITNDALSKADYRGILRELMVGEAKLFEILGDELEAQMAFQLSTPSAAAVSRQSRQGWMLQTPEKYYEYHKMLNQRERLRVIELPVSEFVKQVPDPTDGQLLAFFDQHKGTPPGPDGTPGFLQPRKVQLAYLVADFETNYEHYESLAAQPTEEDVVAYYEANKERYRIRSIPDFPEFPSGDTEAPADAMSPANQPGVEAPVLPAPDATSPATPESDAEKADAEKPANEKPADEKSDAEKPTEEPKGSAEEAPAPAGQAAIFEQPANDAAAEPAPAADEPAKPAAEAPAEEKPAAEAPASEKPAESTDAPAQPGADPAIELPAPAAALPEIKPEEPKYQELDTALQLEIREQLLKERAFEKAQEAANAAVAFMQNLADEYLYAESDKAREALAKQFPAKLKDYAAEHGLRYEETSLLTQQQLIISTDYTIGSAVDPASLGDPRGGTTVALRAFESELLFQPMRADSQLKRQAYAYWKVQDVNQRVPALDDVRAEVVESWKFDQARSLAKSRAEQLAKLVEGAGTDWAAALAGETVAGEGTPAVTVRESSPFTWVSRPLTVPQQTFTTGGEIQLSNIDAVPQVGGDFMRKVFDEMKPLDVAVLPNQPRSAFYVVQPFDRDGSGDTPTDEIAIAAMRQQFLEEGRQDPSRLFGRVLVIPQFGPFPMLTPYDTLSMEPQQQVERAWLEEFERKYAIAWPAANPDVAPDALE